MAQINQVTIVEEFAPPRNDTFTGDFKVINDLGGGGTTGFTVFVKSAAPPQPLQPRAGR